MSPARRSAVPRRLLVLGVALSGSVLSAGGCTPVERDMQLDLAAPARPPLVETLPAVMGVYYGPELRGHEQVAVCESFRHLMLKYRLGEPSVTVFNYVLRGMFRKLVAVSAIPPPPEERAGIDAIIEPRIEGAALPASMQCNISTEVTYGITLYSPAGKQLANWHVSGSSSREPKAFDFQVDRKRAAAVRDALLNAAANFAIGFRDQPGVGSWIESRGLDREKPKGENP